MQTACHGQFIIYPSAEDHSSILPLQHPACIPRHSFPIPKCTVITLIMCNSSPSADIFNFARAMVGLLSRYQRHQSVLQYKTPPGIPPVLPLIQTPTLKTYYNVFPRFNKSPPEPVIAFKPFIGIRFLLQVSASSSSSSPCLTDPEASDAIDAFLPAARAAASPFSIIASFFFFSSS